MADGARRFETEKKRRKHKTEKAKKKKKTTSTTAKNISKPKFIGRTPLAFAFT